MYHFLEEHVHTCNHSPPVGINEGKKTLIKHHTVT